jgi:hypothetical protein
MKTAVYRSGIVTSPTERGVEGNSYREADAVRPVGRQGRGSGIFASPNIHGVLRWVRANSMSTHILDPFVRELSVDPEAVFVYCIRTWERCSSKESGYEKYWETGITLSEWLKNSENYDPKEWELLLSPKDIISQKPVSDKRLVTVAETAEDIYSDLARLLKDARRNFKFNNS